MARGIHRCANIGDVAGHPGGGFRVDHQQRLYLSCWISPQALLDLLSRHAGAVFEFETLYVDTVSGSGSTKQVAEVTVHAAKDFVTGGKCVDNRRLPGSGAGAGKEQHVSFGRLKIFLQSDGDLTK